MYQPVTDFRGGLDTRKMSLSLPAGTLIACNNAHITQGAEIEKRKQFAPIAIPINSVSYSGYTFPTYGVCATTTGLVVFGSGYLATGGTLTATDLALFTAPLVFQQLIHPAVLNGVSYVQANHALTGILHSTLYGSFAFAIAQFADGGIYCYYNGVLVTDFTSGVVLAYMAGNNSQIAAAITQAANAVFNYTANANGANIDLFSDPGSSYSVTLTVLSASNIDISSNGTTTYPTSTVSNTSGKNSPDGTAITIGGQSYRFKTTMAAAYDVQIGATVLATVNNLYLAINATGTAGTNYYTGTLANSQVKASGFNGLPNPTFTVTALALNTVGVTANTLSGVSFTQENPSVSQLVGAYSQGQFTISAVNQPVGNATQLISSTGTNPASGSSITIAGTTYRFETTPSAAYDIKIGTTANLTLANLGLAINANGVAGTNYYTGTLANPYVTASVSGANLTVTAIVAGPAGNSLTIATSGTTHLSFQSPLAGAGNAGVSAITLGPTCSFAAIVPSLSANAANNDTLTIGSTVYTLVTTLPGSPVEGSVLIGLTIGDTLQNIIDAINLTGTYGLNYQVSTPNPQVTALATVEGGVLKIIARVAGTAGNSISLATTSAALTVPATLTGGATSVSLISSAVYAATNQTAAQFCNYLVKAINSQQGTTGFYAKSKNQTVYVYSSAYSSVANGAVISVTTTGAVCTGFCGINFTLGKATGGGSVNSVTINGTQINSAAVSYSTTNSISGMVAALAANINANTATVNGVAINAIWIAVAIGSALYLSNITTASTDTPQTVSVVTDGTYIAYDFIGNAGLTASVAPSAIAMPGGNPSGTSAYSPVVSICTASGGYPPYTYLWQYQAGDNYYVPSSTTSQSVTWMKVWSNTNPYNYCQWVCVVTDSQGNTVNSSVLTLYPG